MTRLRLQSAMMAAVLMGSAIAAPVPKEATKANPAPDLTAFFDTVSKAVKDEKWPAEADEKKLRDTVHAIFARATKAAGAKDRKLPVDFGKVVKQGVFKELKGTKLDGEFVVAGDAEPTVLRDSIIFAGGNIRLMKAINSIIVGRYVRCNSADNCLVIATDSIRVNSTDRKEPDEGSVLVAGRLIRVTGARGAICHVIRPAFGQLFPDEKLGDPTLPPIRISSANQVVVLNAAEHIRVNSDKKNTRAVVPKEPIAR